MERIVITVLLFISISTSNLLAYSVEEFGDDVGYTIFKTAWPTATYRNTEVIRQRSTSTGYDVVIKFNDYLSINGLKAKPTLFKT